MIRASAKMKAPINRGLLSDSYIHLESEMNIKRSVSYVTAESHYNHGYVLMLGS